MHVRHGEDVSLPLANGGILRGHYSFVEEPAEMTVLYIHGFGSQRGHERAQALEKTCDRYGFAFASFDFRGHGNSSGTMIELLCTGLMEDLDAILSFLKKKGIRWICPYGASMGGWAAAWFSLRFPEMVPACAVVAPAFEFPTGRWAHASDQDRELWKKAGRTRVKNQFVDIEVGYGLVEEANQFPLNELILRWQKPLLIFHGMGDTVIPYQNSLALSEQVSTRDVELRLYKNGDHRLLDRKDEMAEAACSFFSRYVPKLVSTE